MYDIQWLDFIVASRKGQKPWEEYDIIEGGVANDQVIDTVEGKRTSTAKRLLRSRRRSKGIAIKIVKLPIPN